jgi:glycosyltransferase A (GT-A) superfamily protein (DUF2064 family)
MPIVNGLIIFDVPGNAIASEDARLSASDRHALRRALFLDACMRAASWPDAAACACVSDDALEADLARLAPKVRLLRAVEGEDRIASAFDEAFDIGYKHLLLLFCSAATVPPRSIEAAFSVMDTFDDAIVVGPTERDGVYAIGTRRPHPDVFALLDADGALRYDALVQQLPATERTVYPLASRPALVTGEDVELLRAEIGALESARAGFEHTRRWFGERGTALASSPGNE